MLCFSRKKRATFLLLLYVCTYGPRTNDIICTVHTNTVDYIHMPQQVKVQYMALLLIALISIIIRRKKSIYYST